LMAEKIGEDGETGRTRTTAVAEKPWPAPTRHLFPIRSPRSKAARQPLSSSRPGHGDGARRIDTRLIAIAIRSARRLMRPGAQGGGYRPGQGAGGGQRSRSRFPQSSRYGKSTSTVEFADALRFRNPSFQKGQIRSQLRICIVNVTFGGDSALALNLGSHRRDGCRRFGACASRSAT